MMTDKRIESCIEELKREQQELQQLQQKVSVRLIQVNAVLTFLVKEQEQACGGNETQNLG